jgi:hypothetical protein
MCSFLASTNRTSIESAFLSFMKRDSMILLATCVLISLSMIQKDLMRRSCLAKSFDKAMRNATNVLNALFWISDFYSSYLCFDISSIDQWLLWVFYLLKLYLSWLESSIWEFSHLNAFRWSYRSNRLFDESFRIRMIFSSFLSLHFRLRNFFSRHFHLLEMIAHWMLISNDQLQMSMTDSHYAFELLVKYFSSLSFVRIV